MALTAHVFLELDGQGGADGLQEPGRAAVLANLDVVVVLLFPPGIGPQHRAAAGMVGHAVVVQLLAEHHHSGSARPAQEFMRRKKYCVQPLSGLRRMHIHGHVGRGGGKINESSSRRGGA